MMLKEFDIMSKKKKLGIVADSTCDMDPEYLKKFDIDTVPLKIIFGDEITANLDVKTSEFIRDIFKQLKSDKKTILLATHHEKLIDLADRISWLRDGNITRTQKKVEVSISDKDVRIPQ